MQIEAPKIPEALFEPCAEPERVEVKTNADVLRMMSNLLEAFDVCRAKHAALAEATKGR